MLLGGGRSLRGGAYWNDVRRWGCPLEGDIGTPVPSHISLFTSKLLCLPLYFLTPGPKAMRSNSLRSERNESSPFKGCCLRYFVLVLQHRLLVCFLFLWQKLLLRNGVKVGRVSTGVKTSLAPLTWLACRRQGRDRPLQHFPTIPITAEKLYEGGRKPVLYPLSCNIGAALRGPLSPHL